ncbi:MAG: hypothetical protein V4551_15605 [Pseudomonadota bacterium]
MGYALEDDVLGIGFAPICKTCGSEHVSKDAWACWNPATGLWELETTFDHEYCHVCEAETSFIWQKVDQVPSRRLSSRPTTDRCHHHVVLEGARLDDRTHSRPC